MDVYNFITLIHLYEMGTNKYNDDWGKVDETPVDVVDETTSEPTVEDFNEPIEPPKGLWGWLKRVLNF